MAHEDDAGKQQPSSKRGAHLKQYQFQPGQSGNPSGRAKGEISLVALIRKRLREQPKKATKIVDNLLNLAGEGDQKAIGALKVLLDRVDGPVVKQVHLNGPEAVDEATALRDMMGQLAQTVPTEPPPGYVSPDRTLQEAFEPSKRPTNTPSLCVGCGHQLKQAVPQCPECGMDPRTGEAIGAPAQ